MAATRFEIIDFSLLHHRIALVKLLNDYMMDEMGNKKPFDPALHGQVLSDLEKHPSYIGFLLKVEDTFVALANCFVNYSTFQGRHLLNIHDYIVSKEHRGMGYGKALLHELIIYAKEKGYCRINLEVREDNVKACALYKSLGFDQCQPNMFFWQKVL